MFTKFTYLWILLVFLIKLGLRVYLTLSDSSVTFLYIYLELSLYFIFMNYLCKYF